MVDLQLQSGEHVLRALRKHPMILVGQLIPFAILDYLPYLIPKAGAFLAKANVASSIDYATLFSFANPWTAFIVGVYWLFVWMGAFGTFVDYFLDQWIVTNQRIIDINQRSFWHREVSSLFLERVQSVETKIEGFFYTLFGFGTVSVESAGPEIGRVRITGLSHPNAVRDLILKEIAKFHHAAPAKAGL